MKRKTAAFKKVIRERKKVLVDVKTIDVLGVKIPVNEATGRLIRQLN